MMYNFKIKSITNFDICVANYENRELLRIIVVRVDL